LKKENLAQGKRGLLRNMAGMTGANNKNYRKIKRLKLKNLRERGT
jgi:hypothetical protein